MIIDAFGKPCPMPLVLAKKEIDAGCRDLSISVDNETAVKNLTRLGGKMSLSVSVDVIEGGFLVSFSEGKEGDALGEKDTAVSFPEGSPIPYSESPPAQEAQQSAGCGYAVFIGKDHVGEGDGELGYNLMKMALYTLSESENVPASLLFMNSGVKLLIEGEDQIIESVQALTEKGCEVLVCGTCLDYYGVKNDLAIGEISNMYDIVERMHEASKVITL